MRGVQERQQLREERQTIYQGRLARQPVAQRQTVRSGQHSDWIVCSLRICADIAHQKIERFGPDVARTPGENLPHFEICGSEPAVTCDLGLALARNDQEIILAGFALSFFMNGAFAGLYAYTPEVFPTEVRGMGAGFAAAFAKIGAVATAFLFPILMAAIGTRALLIGLVVSSILGAVVTWLYRIETTGINLDRIGQDAA